MHDALGMEVRHRLEQIANDHLGRLLLREPILLQISIERKRIQLQYHIGRIIGLEDALHVADIPMADFSEHLELLAEGNLHQ